MKVFFFASSCRSHAVSPPHVSLFGQTVHVAARARGRACTSAYCARVEKKGKEKKREREVRFLSHDATVHPPPLRLRAGCQWQRTYNEVRWTSNNIHQPNHQQQRARRVGTDSSQVSEAESATRQDGRRTKQEVGTDWNWSGISQVPGIIKFHFIAKRIIRQSEPLSLYLIPKY